MRTVKTRLWLVEHTRGDLLLQRGVHTTLKGAWALSKVWLDTNDPNLTYRKVVVEAAARPVQLWCRKRWASEDEALWNPAAEVCTLTLVPLYKLK